MKGKNDRDEENLVRLFGSVSRARVLSFLYAFPGQSFYQREILSETGLTLLAVQSERTRQSGSPWDRQEARDC